MGSTVTMVIVQEGIVCARVIVIKTNSLTRASMAKALLEDKSMVSMSTSNERSLNVKECHSLVARFRAFFIFLKAT